MRKTSLARPAPHRLAWAIHLALAATALGAQAQERSLPAVTVTGERVEDSATAPVDGYVARRSATATKTDTPLEEIPQSISVIGAEQVRDQASATLQDVLRYTAGVRNEMYGLDNRGDWFGLRGSSDSPTLLDGLRLPLTGYWGLLRNEPYAFERIEVLRGPSSVMAGQNGPGGLVNLVSKRPLDQPLREIGVQFGSFGHKQVSADLSGPIGSDGTLSYRLVALGKDSGTQVDHAYDDRTYLAPSIRWKPSSDFSVTLRAEYQRDKTGNANAFFPLAGTLLPAPNGPIPMDTFIGEPAWDRYGGTRKRFGYEVEKGLGDLWTLRHNLRYDNVSGGMRTMYAAWWLGFADATGAPDANGRYLNRIWYGDDDRSRILNTDLLLEGRLQWGGTRHTVLLGVDAMRHQMTRRYWDDALATPLDVYNPVYGSFPALAWDTMPTNLESTRVRNVGVLLQDQVKFGEQWVLTAGLRRDRARSTTVTTLAGGVPTQSEQQDAATSRNLGLVYLGASGWSPYVSYSESFEPVPGTNARGVVFKPKRGQQLEAGLRWAPKDARVSASAAAYQIKEKNRLTTDPDPLNAGFSVQTGEVTVKGLELEVTANLRSWDLIASYTYTDARQTRVTPADVRYLDQQLGGIPRHSASVWGVHRFAEWGLPKLRAGAGLRYVGSTTDGTGASPVPSVTLLDLMLSYDTGPWRLALNVNNATDKAYIATCLERGDCWFGTRRRATLSATYSW